MRRKEYVVYEANRHQRHLLHLGRYYNPPLRHLLMHVEEVPLKADMAKRGKGDSSGELPNARLLLPIQRGAVAMHVHSILHNRIHASFSGRYIEARATCGI